MDHLDIAYEKMNEIYDECVWSQFFCTLLKQDATSSSLIALLEKEAKLRKKWRKRIRRGISESGRKCIPNTINANEARRQWQALLPQDEPVTDEIGIATFIAQEEILLKHLTQLINDGWLPVDILHYLVRMESQLEKSHQKLRKVNPNKSASSLLGRILKNRLTNVKISL